MFLSNMLVSAAAVLRKHILYHSSYFRIQFAVTKTTIQNKLCATVELSVCRRVTNQDVKISSMKNTSRRACVEPCHTSSQLLPALSSSAHNIRAALLTSVKPHPGEFLCLLFSLSCAAKIHNSGWCNSWQYKPLLKEEIYFKLERPNGLGACCMKRDV